jgi:hypothetical protein
MGWDELFQPNFRGNALLQKARRPEKKNNICGYASLFLFKKNTFILNPRHPESEEDMEQKDRKKLSIGRHQ